MSGPARMSRGLARPGRLGSVAALLAFAAPLLATPLHAQTSEDEAQALLRAASTESAIIVFCAKLYALDGTTALRISQTSREVAEKVLGRDRAAAAFKDELARRYAEVARTGEVRWCADQRDAMRDDGIAIFKD